MATATKLVPEFTIEKGTSADAATAQFNEYLKAVEDSGMAMPDAIRMIGKGQNTLSEYLASLHAAALAEAKSKALPNGGKLSVKESSNSPGWLGVYGLNVRRPIGMYAGQWVRFLGENASPNETPIVAEVRKQALACIKAGRGVKTKD